MRLPPLIPARLIQRYKRFLADARLETDGAVVTAHIANPGAMTGLAEPGTLIWLSRADNPKRKLAYTWELASLESGAISGVSTARPNQIVGEALRAGSAPGLEGYPNVRAEAPYGRNSRVDFLLSAPGRPPAYVEVKNVHLMRRPGLAEFPDSVTARGTKHLRELADQAAAGARAVMVYLVHRDDCGRLALAADIDPAYVEAYRAARAAGVEALAYRVRFETPLETRAAVSIAGAIPIDA